MGWGGMPECGYLPPDFERHLADGSACDLPEGHGEVHRTRLPDGRIAEWDGFTCAYPEDCKWDQDHDCCVTWGYVEETTALNQKQ